MTSHTLRAKASLAPGSGHLSCLCLVPGYLRSHVGEGRKEVDQKQGLLEPVSLMLPLSLQALYTHCLFLHEGWPLCLRDEVVVHLAPLNPLLLRQGDFYLQVESWEEQSVHMTLKCLSSDLREVDKKPIPESSYSLIFTPEWLEAINNDFEGRPLHNCLVASENGVTPVPWTKITSPEFVDDRPPTVKVPSSDGDSCPLETLQLGSPQEPYQDIDLDSRESMAQSWDKDKGKLSEDKYSRLIKVESARPGQVAFRIDSEASQSLEGDYVALLGFPPDYRGASPDSEVVPFSVDTQRSQETGSRTMGAPLLGKVLPLSGPAGALPLGGWACAKPASSGEKPCSGGSRRKARHKASGHTAVGQTQQPYASVPEKLMDCTSGLVEDTEEEPAASKMQKHLGMPEAVVQLRPGPRQAFPPLLASAGPVAPASETKTEETMPGHGRVSKPKDCLNKNTAFHGSPAPGIQFSYLKEQRAPLVTPEKTLLQHTRPWKALCSLNSLQPCGAKVLGKGKSPYSAGQGPGLSWYRRLELCGTGATVLSQSQRVRHLTSVELSNTTGLFGFTFQLWVMLCDLGQTFNLSEFTPLSLLGTYITEML